MTIFLATLLFLLMPTVAAHAQRTSTEPAAPQSKALRASPEEPSRELERPFTRDEPIEVELSIYVIDIDDVDSAAQNFSGSVYYEARWHSPALRHEGPGPLTRETTDVWTPRLTIINQQRVWSAFPAHVEISPDGDVPLRQKVWGSFSQPLDLRDFPLDRQTLTIHVIAAALLEPEAVISPLKEDGETDSGIAERLSLPDFRVVSWKAEPRGYVPFAGEEGIAGFFDGDRGPAASELLCLEDNISALSDRSHVVDPAVDGPETRQHQHRRYHHIGFDAGRLSVCHRASSTAGRVLYAVGQIHPAVHAYGFYRAVADCRHHKDDERRSARGARRLVVEDCLSLHAASRSGHLVLAIELAIRERDGISLEAA